MAAGRKLRKQDTAPTPIGSHTVIFNVKILLDINEFQGFKFNTYPTYPMANIQNLVDNYIGVLNKIDHIHF